MPRRAFLLSIVFLTGSASAQEFRATVCGQVTDSTGAIVPGAVVSVTSLERNTSFQGISNTSGRYVIEFLPPGQYSLAAEKTGFKKLIRPRLSLAANDHVSLDLALQ